jgi:predicted nucleic acid-binding protein
VDGNIVLDVLEERQPHFAASRAVWVQIETGKAAGFLAAHAVATIHYLIRKQLGDAHAREVLSALLTVFQVAVVDEAVLREAVELKGSDFEDAGTAIAGQMSGCDFIVTRDPKGFRHSPVTAMTPEAVLPLLG